MTRSQLISRSSLVAIALLNLSLASGVNAEPIRVTRGPNGATHVVNMGHIPVDAKLQPTTEAHEFPHLVQRGPKGAHHIAAKTGESMSPMSASQAEYRLITRGPNGAGVLVRN